MHLPACQFDTVAVNINSICLTALSSGEVGTKNVVACLSPLKFWMTTLSTKITLLGVKIAFFFFFFAEQFCWVIYIYFKLFKTLAVM